MKTSARGEHALLFLGFCFFYFFFIAFLSLWQRDRMHRMGYAIDAIQGQKAERMKLHKALLVEVERLNGLNRIEQVAVTQLSMVPASPGERIPIQKESELRKRS